MSRCRAIALLLAFDALLCSTIAQLDQPAGTEPVAALPGISLDEAASAPPPDPPLATHTCTLHSAPGALQRVSCAEAPGTSSGCQVEMRPDGSVVSTCVGPSPAAAECLAAHNAERFTVGVRLLAWDTGLAAGAQSRASAVALGLGDPFSLVGENQWLGEGPAALYSYAGMIGEWVAERRHFRNSVFPDVSITDSSFDVFRYSQLVWRDTEHVGCARAESAAGTVFVCLYEKHGNIIGRKVY